MLDNRSRENLEVAYQLSKIIKGDDLRYSTRDLLTRCIRLLVVDEREYDKHFSDLDIDFVHSVVPH